MKRHSVLPAMATQSKSDLTADYAATQPVRPTITQRANQIQTTETRAL